MASIGSRSSLNKLAARSFMLRGRGLRGSRMRSAFGAFEPLSRRDLIAYCCPFPGIAPSLTLGAQNGRNERSAARILTAIEEIRLGGALFGNSGSQFDIA